MLSGRASAEEQMAAAAAELASSSVPLARLALPTVSEGPLNVLQVGPLAWITSGTSCPSGGLVGWILLYV